MANYDEQWKVAIEERHLRVIAEDRAHSDAMLERCVNMTEAPSEEGLACMGIGVSIDRHFVAAQ